MSGEKISTTSGNQISLEENETSSKVIENEAEAFEQYATDSLPETSPVDIPSDADVEIQTKSNYNQVQYKWGEGEYKYTARWHTKTPNSPSYESESWVIERRIPGIGFGKNARPRIKEVLVGKKWVSKKIWQKAITAKKNGSATKEQKELLKNGHHKSKK